MTKRIESAKIKITCKVANNRIRIYMDGHLHVSVCADDICATVSYRSCGYFHIDIYMKETTVELTYKREEVWMGILDELDKLNIL